MLKRNENTTVLCADCHQPHPARYVEREGAMFLVTDCPRGVRELRVSHDAQCFRALRERVPELEMPCERRPHIFFLHITDRCSLRCPVCYADSGDGGEMTLDDLRRRARVIREAGGRFVTLTGGEPTEHPQLTEIIRILHREYHLSVSLATNGVRLGAEPELARSLKRAGLRKIFLSFDSFRPEVSIYMRGVDCIAVKLRALEYAWQAKLNTALIVTVCDRNLTELGEIAQFALKQAPKITVVLLQPMVGGGRLPETPGFVDREMLLKELLRSLPVPGLKWEHFIPVPSLPLLGLHLHPDCCTLLPLTLQHGEARPLGELLDLDSLAAALRDRIRHRGWRGRLEMAGVMWRYGGGWRGWARIFRWWRGAAGGESLLLFGIDNILAPDRQDCERMARCGACRVEADGTLPCMCQSYTLPNKS